MASFERNDYHTVFNFAAMVWRVSVRDATIRRAAAAVMDLCEMVLGQMDRPDRPRGNG